MQSIGGRNKIVTTKANPACPVWTLAILPYLLNICSNSFCPYLSDTPLTNKRGIFHAITQDWIFPSFTSVTKKPWWHQHCYALHIQRFDFKSTEEKLPKSSKTTIALVVQWQDFRLPLVEKVLFQDAGDPGSIPGKCKQSCLLVHNSARVSLVSILTTALWPFCNLYPHMADNKPVVIFVLGRISFSTFVEDV